MIRFFFKMIALLLALPVLYIAWTAADIVQTSKRHDDAVVDAIVVMGAAQYDGKPSAVFKARLDHAGDLYRAKVAPLIIILGGKQEGDRFTEAQAGAAYLEKKLPADKVTGVKAGKTTLDSLQKLTGLAAARNVKKIVIVSDPLHLARSQEIAKDLGFEAGVSAASIPESERSRRSGLIRETLTLTYYRMFQ